ncbi:MAG: type 4a pilus biogenesis protein PilO [Patescibacteria group bacterium]|nr:type 4a pilus biogenesis protein PilO [Patescibacteria group bacterium]
MSLILVVVLILPQYQNLKSVQEEINQKRAEIKYSQEHFLKLNELSGELGKYSTQLSKIDSALPLSPSLPSLFGFLQKTSSESGLILKRFGEVTSESLPEREKIKEHSLPLALSGSYSSFKSFLSSLEKTARLIEIESLSFSSLEGPPFNFNLKIKFHSY